MLQNLFSDRTLASTAPAFMVFGFYLSVFFHISHNYDGVQQLADTQPNKSWLYNQVNTTLKTEWNKTFKL